MAWPRPCQQASAELTAALLTLDQIRAMVDELFAAHKAYLPAELSG